MDGVHVSTAVDGMAHSVHRADVVNHDDVVEHRGKSWPGICLMVAGRIERRPTVVV